MNEIINIDALHEFLEEFLREVGENNSMSSTRAQTWHGAKTNMQPLNVSIGGYVMVRTPAKREYKLQTQ